MRACAGGRGVSAIERGGACVPLLFLLRSGPIRQIIVAGGEFSGRSWRGYLDLRNLCVHSRRYLPSRHEFGLVPAVRQRGRAALRELARHRILWGDGGGR